MNIFVLAPTAFKRLFFWSLKCFTLPQPTAHLLIKISLLHNICTKISHACCSLCRLAYITALDRWNYQLLMELLANFISRSTKPCFWQWGPCTCCRLLHIALFSTTSTAENSAIQGWLKPSHTRLLRVNVSSHRHMTKYAKVWCLCI